MQACQAKSSLSTSAAKLPACHRCTACTKSLPEIQGPKLASTFSCRRCTSVAYTGSTCCTSAESTWFRLLGSILVTTASHPSCSRRSPQQLQMWTVPGEAQGRGFTHGHGKGHSRIGVTVAWIRDVLQAAPAAASQRINEDERSSLACSCVGAVRVCQ